MIDSAALESRDDPQAQGASYWHTALALAEKDHKDFIHEGRAVYDIYRGERDAARRGNKRRLNILYSNVETLRAALFARMAKPDVRRRFTDQDPVGREVAEVTERSLIYCEDAYDAEVPTEAALEDYLIAGRGVLKVVYEATIDGADGMEAITDQDLRLEYVHWEDFRHEPAKSWSQVTWIAFRHLMGRDALRENFPEHGDSAPLNWSPEPDNNKIPDMFKRAEVWEIWDKSSKQRLWVINGYKEILRSDGDPYGLRHFWPIARPLQAICTNQTFIPRPEYEVYRDQADSLDEIESRIDRLTRALKRRGVYDAAIKELARLAKAADNEFVPVNNYAELSSKGGLAAAFQSEDITVLAVVLKELQVQREMRIQAIHEVTGISDILRGSTDPDETLGAQQLKAQFGGARLKKRQDKVQKWIRDTLRIKAEIIAEHFQPEKLAAMTNRQIDPQVMELLRSDLLRSYRVDVETDSTVFEDAENEKKSRTEFLTAMTAFLERAIPAGQAMPQLVPLMFELLAFGARGYKAGRQLEEVIEQAKAQVMQQLQAPPPPPPPDPKVEAEKIKAEAVMQKTQLELQRDQAKHGMEMERMQAEAMRDEQKLALDGERLNMQAQKMAMQGPVA